MQKIVSKIKEWQKAHPEKMEEYRLKRVYGVTSAFVAALRKKQKNRCALCGKKFRRWDKVHIDHCHRTKQVRGILHFTCNLRLGTIEDPKFVRQALAYLRRFR